MPRASARPRRRESRTFSIDTQYAYSVCIRQASGGECLWFQVDLEATFVQPVGDLGRRQRAGQVVALYNVAAERPKQPPRLGVLDALGDHAQTEVVPELDRRADDDRVVAVVAHAHDEGLVDL